MNSLPEPICGHCGAGACKSSTGPLLVCSRCHAVRYCDAECQKRDWRYGGHRESCNRLVGILKEEKKVHQDTQEERAFVAEEDSDSCSSLSSAVSSTSASSSSSSTSASSSSSSSSDKTFRLEELRFALYHMPDSPRVGPDGFPILFYKSFFDHLGPPLLRVLEETFAKVGGKEADPAQTKDWLRSGLAAREVVSVPREKKKLVSLRGSIQRVLRLSQDDNGSSVPDEGTSSTSSSSSTASTSALPASISTSVKSRPAIIRQLRAMSLHPEADYVIFSPPPSTVSSSVKKNSECDAGVVILNADARLLFRVNWNHAVFATPREAVKPHARLLFEQLRGPPPRADEGLDRLLASQLKKEFGCDFLYEYDETNLDANLTLDTETDQGMTECRDTDGDDGLSINDEFCDSKFSTKTVLGCLERETPDLPTNLF